MTTNETYAWISSHFTSFILRTSDYETLQLSKQRQNTLAEKSRIDPPGLVILGFQHFLS